MPSGPQTNIDMKIIYSGGWEECFKAGYSQGSSGRKISEILKVCSKRKLMLACKVASASKMKLLAWAERADVSFETKERNPNHVSYGTSWYLNSNGSPSLSWGFAKAGSTISRSNCDTAAGNEHLRLCWHTSSCETHLCGTISNGYRCGDTGDSKTNVEMLILHKD